ncbi:MAG: hypothetical protein ACOY33_08735 [Pseudomonadota bacterium]
MSSAVIGLVLWAGILLAFHATTGWVPLLDSANLAFHEAGHPLFGMIHERLMVYGGTFMQLLMPAACWFEMRRQEKFNSASFCAIWFAESLLNVARYMADARAKQLPLTMDPRLGHDWSYILNNWNAIRYDTMLADGVRLLAVVLIAWTLLAAWRREKSSA